MVSTVSFHFIRMKTQTWANTSKFPSVVSLLNKLNLVKTSCTVLIFLFLLQTNNHFKLEISSSERETSSDHELTILLIKDYQE